MGRHIYTNGKVPFIFTGWILLTQFFFVKAVPILMKMYMNTKYIKCNTFNQLFHKNINHKDQSPKKYHSLTSVISVRSLTIVTLPTQLSNVDFFFFFIFILVLLTMLTEQYYLKKLEANLKHQSSSCYSVSGITESWLHRRNLQAPDWFGSF